MAGRRAPNTLSGAATAWFGRWLRRISSKAACRMSGCSPISPSRNTPTASRFTHRGLVFIDGDLAVIFPCGTGHLSRRQIFQPPFDFLTSCSSCASSRLRLWRHCRFRQQDKDLTS